MKNFNVTMLSLDCLSRGAKPWGGFIYSHLTYFFAKAIEAYYLEFLITFASYFNIIKRNYYLPKLIFSGLRPLIKKLNTLSFSIESCYLSFVGWVFIKGSSDYKIVDTGQTNYSLKSAPNSSEETSQYSPEEPEDPKNEDLHRNRNEDGSQLVPKSPIFPHPPVKTYDNLASEATRKDIAREFNRKCVIYM